MKKDIPFISTPQLDYSGSGDGNNSGNRNNRIGGGNGDDYNPYPWWEPLSDADGIDLDFSVERRERRKFKIGNGRPIEDLGIITASKPMRWYVDQITPKNTYSEKMNRLQRFIAR